MVAGVDVIADLQRATTACTRCFGCRHELERMLVDALGERYVHEATITLPAELGKKGAPARPMYMPVIVGFAGNDVDTSVIVFNYGDSSGDVGFRLDLLRPDGSVSRSPITP
jgi:hypothetical protein